MLACQWLPILLQVALRNIDHSASFCSVTRGAISLFYVAPPSLTQALEYGESLGLDLPLTSAVKGMYDSLITEGHGDLDHSALVKIIEGEVPHEPQNQ